MNLQLENKLALVTGSTAGIGFAIARVLANEGARVIINGRSEKRVAEAITTIRAEIPSAKLQALALDLSKAEAASEAMRRFPNVDILVNNLGAYELKSFEQITNADWSAIIETNFLSGVRLSRHYLLRMKAAGWGRIIFISSESAVNIPVEMIHYGVTKTMQVALARGLAETTAGTGVTINSVLAGPTRSEGVENFIADMAKTKNTTSKEVEREFSTPCARVRCCSALPRPTRWRYWLRLSPARSLPRQTAQRCARTAASCARFFEANWAA